ncbi:MAG: hypothetical protein ACI8UO_001092 [Verrucomicrobiales bacterium]|jgi:hypothetical protein
MSTPAAAASSILLKSLWFIENFLQHDRCPKRSRIAKRVTQRKCSRLRLRLRRAFASLSFSLLDPFERRLFFLRKFRDRSLLNWCPGDRRWWRRLRRGLSRTSCQFLKKSPQLSARTTSTLRLLRWRRRVRVNGLQVLVFLINLFLLLLLGKILPNPAKEENDDDSGPPPLVQIQLGEWSAKETISCGYQGGPFCWSNSGARRRSAKRLMFVSAFAFTRNAFAHISVGHDVFVAGVIHDSEIS